MKCGSCKRDSYTRERSNQQTLYRPILPIRGKLFEKNVFKQLSNYLVSNNLITNNQSGVNQLTDLINNIHKSFDNSKSHETHAVFLDISEAFDKLFCFSNSNRMVFHVLSSTFCKITLLIGSKC